jgi:hypothetical protein
VATDRDGVPTGAAEPHHAFHSPSARVSLPSQYSVTFASLASQEDAPSRGSSLERLAIKMAKPFFEFVERYEPARLPERSLDIYEASPGSGLHGVCTEAIVALLAAPENQQVDAPNTHDRYHLEQDGPARAAEIMPATDRESDARPQHGE